jgi:hypothetical protein
LKEHEGDAARCAQRAFDAESGKILWQTDLPGAPGGEVISYLADGKQRVTFIAGTRTAVLPVTRRARRSSSSVCERPLTPRNRKSGDLSGSDSV